MKPYKRYTPEFKTQAVEFLTAGKPVSELAGELQISASQLDNWRPRAQGAKTPGSRSKTTF